MIQTSEVWFWENQKKLETETSWCYWDAQPSPAWHENDSQQITKYSPLPSSYLPAFPTSFAFSSWNLLQSQRTQKKRSLQSPNSSIKHQNLEGWKWIWETSVQQPPHLFFPASLATGRAFLVHWTNGNHLFNCGVMPCPCSLSLDYDVHVEASHDSHTDESTPGGEVIKFKGNCGATGH